MRATVLIRKSWKQSEVAEALGVTKGAVSQWIKKYETEGRKALRSIPRKGAPPRLTPAQKNQLPELLSRGAESYGFRGQVWTCARVRTVIEQEFGVSYHKHHVARIMKEIGWTPHKPIVRASQRNEAEIERWRSEVWPRLKKSPSPGKETFSPR